MHWGRGRAVMWGGSNTLQLIRSRYTLPSTVDRCRPSVAVAAAAFCVPDVILSVSDVGVVRRPSVGGPLGSWALALPCAVDRPGCNDLWPYSTALA